MPASCSVSRLFGCLRRSECGVSAIEFALLAPMLSFLLLGGYDLSKFIGVRSGVDKATYSVADVTSQYEQLNSSTMKVIFGITKEQLPGYNSGVTGVTVLTSIYLSGTTPKVRWQCYSTTSSKWTSKIGAEGATATVGSGLLADVNDNVIVAEVYYTFSPLFFRYFTGGAFDVYNMALYRPRLGSLGTKPC